jgi:hypothetical protein
MSPNNDSGFAWSIGFPFDPSKRLMFNKLVAFAAILVIFNVL